MPPVNTFACPLHAGSRDPGVASLEILNATNGNFQLPIEPRMDYAAMATTLEELVRDMRKVHLEAYLDSIRPEVTLRDWTPSFREVATLQGLALGHPVIGNKIINTSELFFIDAGRGLARTLTRWYRLADPTRGHQGAVHNG